MSLEYPTVAVASVLLLLIAVAVTASLLLLLLLLLLSVLLLPSFDKDTCEAVSLFSQISFILTEPGIVYESHIKNWTFLPFSTWMCALSINVKIARTSFILPHLTGWFSSIKCS